MHGANRLGGNSLIDLVVFGKAASLHINDYLKGEPMRLEVKPETLERALLEFECLTTPSAKVVRSFAEIRQTMQLCMQKHFSVYRDAPSMLEGLQLLEALQLEIQDARVNDTSSAFNVEKIEALETQNMLLVSQAVARSALYRRESRGAHSRVDFPERSKQWQAHVWIDAKGELSKRAVRYNTQWVEPLREDR